MTDITLYTYKIITQDEGKSSSDGTLQYFMLLNIIIELIEDILKKNPGKLV